MDSKALDHLIYGPSPAGLYRIELACLADVGNFRVNNDVLRSYTQLAMAAGQSKQKKAWEQPVVFRPSEQDRHMLDWLSERLYLKPAQVIRQAIKRLYDAEKRRSRR